jgi:glycosyltransferase involved in cell wall biosynthesis
MRYKECHGSVGARTESKPAPVAADAQTHMTQAAALLASGDLAAAERSAREALQLAPSHPEALRLLGDALSQQGDAPGALASLLEAAKSLGSVALAADDQYRIWNDLGAMFSQALSGMDSANAAALRTQYDAWKHSRPATDESPLVSVVVIATGRVEWTLNALRSIDAQTYAPIEVVLIDDDLSARSAVIGVAFESLTGSKRRLRASGTVAEILNAGVRASSGAFVCVIDGADRLQPARIASMVDAVARREHAWGFGNVAFIDRDGAPLTGAQNPAVREALELLEAIPESDTIGFSLLHRAFVAVAAGNLFFNRALFDQLDGFRPVPDYTAWDFALRALWLHEPVYVGEATLEHRQTEAAPTPAAQARLEGSQVAMFREYYARACSEETAPNFFAPSLTRWQNHFLKTPFQVGHVLAFPMARLEAIAATIAEHRPDAAAGVARQGINLIGFAFGEFGLGENLRALATACQVGDIPFIVRDVDLKLKTRQADRSMTGHIADELRYACSLFCLNPDMLKPIASLLLPGEGARRYNIGFWFWELEQIPRQWRGAIDSVDEIWVASEFVAHAMRRATDKPVLKVPTPIEVRLSHPYARSDFALPDDRFLFLFSFDFNSFVMRKNPTAAIDAFLRAFPATRRDVGLVIKSINGGNQPDKLEEMRARIAGHEGIVLLDGFMSRDQVSGLQSVVDCYVSLHRAEGLGLGLAESMYLGKPVIGTGYSGNLEFMTAGNSCLVGYHLVPIEKGQYLYDDERFVWAEPDVEQAAQWMRRLVDDREFRDRIAQRGQHDIRSRFTHANAAGLMRARLAELDLL